MKRLILLFLFMFTLSCSPTKRIAFYQKKIDSIAQKNSIKISDTVFTTVYDTIYTLPDTVREYFHMQGDTDTFVVENTRVKVQMIRVRDSVFLQGICKTDTIYREIEVPVEVNKYLVHDFNYFGKWILGIFIVGLIIFIVYKVLKTYFKLF